MKPRNLFIAGAVIGLIVWGYALSNAPTLSDPKSALEQGISQVKKSGVKITQEEEELLKVQLALADFIASNGTPPESLAMLVPKYFDAVPKDSKSGKELAYAKSGMGFKLGAQVGTGNSMQIKKGSKSKLTELAMVNPNTLDIGHFTYDPTGRRDPFESFDFSPDGKIDMTKPPLERYTLGQLKVTAILSDFKGTGSRSAIVEDATGKGYSVRKGTKLGNRDGVIVAIDEDKIHVVESVVDFTGIAKKYPSILNLVREDLNAQVQDNLNKNLSR